MASTIPAAVLNPKGRPSRPRSASRHLDQFYTRPDIAQRCIARTRELIGPVNEQTLWIEPSAGDGAFLNALPSPRIGLDIAPVAEGILKADFLNWHPECPPKHVIVIGNPPFGKNASLAIRFFNRAAHFADYIAFIVPRTFEKESTKHKLAPYMKLVFEENLGPECFTFDGVPYDVPTVFQIWRRGMELRSFKRKITRHPDFEFLKSPEGADFAFQRVGARAGLVSLEGLHKSPQSHYFIRVDKRALNVMGILQGIDWSKLKHRTAGNPSIGKSELISEYQKVAR